MNQSDRPNVILLTIDCWRYDRNGFNGHFRDTTPFLDNLAGDSVIFDNAFATGPQTSESIPGFLAGRLSHECAYFQDPRLTSLRPDTTTLASYLRDYGFDTNAIISNANISKIRNYHIGFNDFTNIWVEENGERYDKSQNSTASNLIVNNLWRLREKLRGDSIPYPLMVPGITAYRAYQLWRGWPTVPASKLLSTVRTKWDNASSPKFLWTHLMDLHGPLHPKRVSDSDLGHSNVFQQFMSDTKRMLNKSAPNHHFCYDNVLRYVDSQISKLVKWLKDRGEWNDTIFIVTGDHGEALGDRDHYGHNPHYSYDELLHIPLLINAPKLSSRRIQQPTTLAWLHEMICDLISVPRANFPQQSQRNEHFSEDNSNNIILSDALTENGHTIIVRDRKWKYIKHYGDLSKVNYPTIEEAAFRYRTDKGERNPLQPPDHLSEHPDKMATSVDELESIDGELDPETSQQLRELGYLV